MKLTMQRKKLRLIREPNDDNLAFGNNSTQPRPHESNTATDDHEETEDDARNDGENQKLSSRGRFIRLRGRCNNCPTCVCVFLSPVMTCIRLLTRTCIRHTNWL